MTESVAVPNAGPSAGPNVGPVNLSVYEDRRKSSGVAYLLWLFLGLFGVHRIYAHAGKTGWLMMAMWCGGWALLAAAVWFGGQFDTQTIQTALGVESFTNISMSPSGDMLAWAGKTLRTVVGLWWFLDLFLIPGMIRRWNNKVAAELGLAGRL